jgi:hypothetical protein
MSSSSYDIFILDTGDYNILAFQPKNVQSNVIQTAISMYEQFDVTINLIDLNMSVNKEVKDFIKSICGRLIPYNNSAIVVGDVANRKQVVATLDDLMKYNADESQANVSSDMGNIVDKLKYDLKQIISFYKIKSFWSSYTKDISDVDPSKKNNQATPPPLLDVAGHDEKVIEFGLVNEAFSSKVLPKDWLAGYRVPEDRMNDTSLITISSKRDKIVSNDTFPLSYIIFNNVYNISLFIRENPSVKDTCDEFPEFEIVETFDSNKISQSTLENCYSLFNKKTFLSKQSLIEKLESFKKLYDIPKNDNNPYTAENVSEKDKVIRFMNNMYIMNDDPTYKIGASELYNTVMNHLCIPFEDKIAFRKRLAGYFIELGLTRKRYTDGYSYYGIKLRYDDNKKTGPISIEEIMKKRTEEKQEWINKRT